MAEVYPTKMRGFAILRYVSNIPALASCELCQLKFFVPSEMMNDPERAQGYLQQKYLNHRCKGYW